MIKILFLFLFFLFHWNSGHQALAQNKQKADSLMILLKSNSKLNDSIHFKILEEIAINSPDPSQIIHYANKAYKIAKVNNKPEQLASARYLAGEGYKARGDLARALEAFLESETYYNTIGSERGQAAVYNGIASVYSVQKDYQKALHFYGLAVGTYQHLQDSLRWGITLQNKGNTFRKISEFDSALNAFNQSLSLFNAVNFDLGRAYNIGNIGIIQAQKGQFLQAEKSLKEAIDLLKDYGDNYAISDFSIQMSDIYLENNQLQNAFQYAHQSLRLAEQEGFKEQIRDASMMLSELYAKTKTYEKAYQYHTQYVAYRDSINNEEVIRKMADLRTEYEVSQKQAEIDLLTKQRQLNQIILSALLFILVLVAILAFVLYRNNLHRKSINRVLSSQNDALETQHLKLEALNNTKDRFFSIISHDLRGPVNAFNGISELIKHYIARNEMGQLREISEYIDKSARQLSILLDNLLDWSVKQQGAFPFFPEKLRLNPLLEEIIQMFMIAAHGKKIDLTLSVEEELEVWADRNSLMTILRNLVNNALKFTEAKGLVSVSAYCEKGYALINIIDTGIGIPEDKLDQLFNLKEKTVSRGTAGEKGLGIGLSLAYEFAAMNKGSIIVNSEENAGTIFTVKIPLFEHSDNYQSRKNQQTVQATSTFNN